MLRSVILCLGAVLPMVGSEAVGATSGSVGVGRSGVGGLGVR